MQTSKERQIALAHAILDWNREYLHKNSKLSEALIGEYFAERFVVEPNGRRYEANCKTYKEFLHDMKSTVNSIQYRVIHALADEDAVVLSMHVDIRKTDLTTEHYRAMLLLKFDASEKIILWHEIYVRHEI